MNLLFFLTPKCDVCVLEKDFTLRQAIEKLRASGRAAVPVIDEQGYYCGSVSEGDLLRGVLADVAEMPRLEADAGDLGLVCRISEDEAEFITVVRQPCRGGLLREGDVGGGYVVHVDAETRLMLAASRYLDDLRRLGVGGLVAEI